MTAKATRLELGEWLLGGSSVLLLIDLFGLTWFAYRPQYHATATMLGQPVSANGWQTFEVIGPLALAVCLAGVAVAWFTASRRSPAVPTVIATLQAPLSFALAVLVIIRVLLDRPSVHLAQASGANVIDVRPGAFAGLVLSVAIFVGCFLVLRRDGTAAADSSARIPTLSVERTRTESRA